MRTSRPSTNPRKHPRQERALATVDAIVQAATYILVRFGWERFTTNAIAERAGVNIGSLYQYFPNKEAIVAELQRRHIAQTRQKLTAELSRLSSQHSLGAALTLLVRAMVEEHRVAPAVHRAIAEELPQSVKCPGRDDGEIAEQLLGALQPFMENVPDPPLAIHMALVSAHALIHDAASYRPELLDRDDFVDEVVILLASHLRRPAPKPGDSCDDTLSAGVESH